MWTLQSLKKLLAVPPGARSHLQTFSQSLTCAALCWSPLPCCSHTQIWISASPDLSRFTTHTPVPVWLSACRSDSTFILGLKVLIPIKLAVFLFFFLYFPLNCSALFNWLHTRFSRSQTLKGDRCFQRPKSGFFVEMSTQLQASVASGSIQFDNEEKKNLSWQFSKWNPTNFYFSPISIMTMKTMKWFVYQSKNVLRDSKVHLKGCYWAPMKLWNSESSVFLFLYEHKHGTTWECTRRSLQWEAIMKSRWRHTFLYLCFEACVSSKMKSSKWIYYADNISSCRHRQAAQLNAALAHFVKRSKKWHIFRQHCGVGSAFFFFSPFFLYRHRFNPLSQDTILFFFWSSEPVITSPSWQPPCWYFSRLLKLITQTHFYFYEKNVKRNIFGIKRATAVWSDTSMLLHSKWLPAFRCALVL